MRLRRDFFDNLFDKLVQIYFRNIFKMASPSNKDVTSQKLRIFRLINFICCKSFVMCYNKCCSVYIQCIKVHTYMHFISNINTINTIMIDGYMFWRHANTKCLACYHINIDIIWLSFFANGICKCSSFESSTKCMYL